MSLSADLQVVRWIANLKTLLPSSDTNMEIEHITLASARSVIRGLLRNRQDIATILDPTPDEASDLLDLVQVLCVIGRKPEGTRALTLVQVQPRSADLATVETFTFVGPAATKDPERSSLHFSDHSVSFQWCHSYTRRWNLAIIRLVRNCAETLLTVCSSRIDCRLLSPNLAGCHLHYIAKHMPSFRRQVQFSASCPLHEP